MVCYCFSVHDEVGQGRLRVATPCPSREKGAAGQIGGPSGAGEPEAGHGPYTGRLQHTQPGYPPRQEAHLDDIAKRPTRAHLHRTTAGRQVNPNETIYFSLFKFILLISRLIFLYFSTTFFKMKCHA